MLLLKAWRLLLFIIIFHLDITDGTCYFLVHGICYCQLFFPVRHNRWDMLLFSAWCLLLFIIIFHLDITDGTCYF